MRRPALALCLLAACGDPSGTSDPDAATTAPDAARPDPGASMGTFQLTYYWIAFEGDYTGAADTPLYDASCATLATVPAAFVDAITLEGTGRLVDGRLLNDDGACACPSSPCFVVADADHPWGYGVQDRALVPFRTVAVDPTVVTYGTGLYLPALDGVTMPGDTPWGGYVHDGCVVAGDTGGGIIGQHLDFFVGLRDEYTVLDGELGLNDLEVDDGGDRCPDQP